MAYLRKIQDYLKGKKTYLLAVVAVITALVAWSEGGLSLTELLTALFVAFQTMFIRAGVSKGTDKIHRELVLAADDIIQECAP